MWMKISKISRCSLQIHISANILVTLEQNGLPSLINSPPLVRSKIRYNKEYNIMTCLSTICPNKIKAKLNYQTAEHYSVKMKAAEYFIT